MDSQCRILITGASRGIGRATAVRLVDAGYEVFGTSRNPGSIPAEDLVKGVTYLRLELSDEAGIDELVRKIGKIDVLINNAGSSQNGPVEEIPFHRIRYLFDVNFFGHLRLIQGLLPRMRENGKGLIINITSLAGKKAVPFSSVYAATKHAFEGLTDGLRNEVRGFGIRVVTVAPSAVHTRIEQEVQYGDASPYFRMARLVREKRDKYIESAPGPDSIARMIERIVMSRNPPPWVPAGRHAILMMFLLRILPTVSADAVLSRIYRLRAPRNKVRRPFTRISSGGT